MTTKAPNPNEQKTRTLRLDDARWEYFRNNGGAEWLREMIDDHAAKAIKQSHKTLTSKE